jgi:hypothetical protein
VFLTAPDLRELTGYQKPTLQRRSLAEHGYKFDVRADGRAVVLIAAIEQKLAARRASGGEPDWSALELTPRQWVAAERTTSTCPEASRSSGARTTFAALIGNA